MVAAIVQAEEVGDDVAANEHGFHNAFGLALTSLAHGFASARNLADETRPFLRSTFLEGGSRPSNII